jgi:hypothetical protein
MRFTISDGQIVFVCPEINFVEAFARYEGDPVAKLKVDMSLSGES